MSLRIHDLVFVDFEASSLEPQSWPVEVGLAWIEGGEVKSWSSLIRPAPDWSMDAWSPVSAKIHNIPLEELLSAPMAWDVATEFLRRTKGKALVSDAPEYESKWATRLVHVAMDCPEVEFSYYDSAAGFFFQEKALDCLYERIERIRVPHRGGPDAERLAKGFLRAMEIDNLDPSQAVEA